MDNKITLPALVALLSEKSGIQKKQCEEFVKEFFSLISSTLEAGENVKVKGFGTFKVMSVETRKSVNVSNGRDITIPGHKKIVFVPARELADEVNAPFSMFESVELAPGIEEEIEEKTAEVPEVAETSTAEPLYTIDEDVDQDLADTPGEEVSDSDSDSDDPIDSDDSTEEESMVAEAVAESESADRVALAASTEQLVEEVPSADNPESPESIESPEIHSDADNKVSSCANEEEPNTPDEETGDFVKTEDDSSDIVSDYAVRGFERKEEARLGRFKFLIGFACGLALAVVVCLAGYWYFLKHMRATAVDDRATVETVDSSRQVATVVKETVGADTTKTASAEPQPMQPTDDAADYPDTKPSDSPVYDTIGDHRFLTTMAKDHYGNYNLWPYIYEENKSFIGHPDRIKPGTQIVIPPLSKYGVDPNNPEDIRKAKKLGIEIYARYR